MPILLESIDGGLIGCTFHEDGQDSYVVLMVTLEGQTIRVRLHPEVADLLGAEIRKDASESPLRPVER